MPLAFVGGAITLPSHWYKVLVGVVLLVSAGRLIWEPDGPTRTPHPVRSFVAILCGAGIGLLSGLTGTGGGIFLSPLLLFTSAAFIVANSAAGLAGDLTAVRFLPPEIPVWLLAVVIGGLLGSELGSRRVGVPAFRRLLALVLLIAGGKLILAV